MWIDRNSQNCWLEGRSVPAPWKARLAFLCEEEHWHSYVLVIPLSGLYLRDSLVGIPRDMPENIETSTAYNCRNAGINMDESKTQGAEGKKKTSPRDYI